jgi:hypothetical protein
LVIDKYPDGSFQDRALFYAAEAESRLGNKEKAIRTTTSNLAGIEKIRKLLRSP